jgi:rhamnulose-1-phosphate aldolase/alcohol dehydrogenase
MTDLRTADPVAELVARSRELGADRRNTNYGGGNTSAKGEVPDPVTGGDVPVLWVKGSGGDLGTLTESGLARLRLDRLRALVDVYPGPEAEDEMVELISEHCRFGTGGAAPSIDTSMHGLVDQPHVDHLHPDSIIALATAADGPALVRECFGERIAWVDWRRPGFQLGLDIAALQRDNPDLEGVVLGGHGLTTWGRTSEECRQRSLDVIAEATRFLQQRGKDEPFGPVVDSRAPLPEDQRRRRAIELAPVIRGLASTDQRVVGHVSFDPAVLDFMAGESLDRLAPLGTSCPDHLIRTKPRPLVLDTPADCTLELAVDRLRELHAAFREEYANYYGRYADESSPPMRGRDPLIVLVPGVAMFSFGRDAATARIAGEYYIAAINAMRGAESVSTYTPVDESEKFNVEYWWLEEAKLRRLPAPKRLATRIALVTGGASGIGRATAQRLVDEGAVVVVADRDAEGAAQVAEELGGRDKAVPATMDVTSEEAVADAVATACLSYGGIDLVVNSAGLSLSKPLLETTRKDWDLQHDVLSLGSFLVARAAASAMIPQGLGGDLVWIVSKNGLFAGPNNLAYGSAKADQAHQVRLLAVELGEHGIRVNGINPDGVVRGSGIFSSGWGAQRAAVYGVDESELGEFYARRTILKQEVLPEHVAAAVVALTGGDMAVTTGLLIPVDSGVAAAFLR